MFGPQRKRYQSKKKFLEAQRRFRIHCIVSGVLALLLLIGGVYLLRLEQLQITTVTVSQTQHVDEATVINQVSSLLEKKYLFIIPKSNILLFPKRAITQTLLDTHISFENVIIKRSGLNMIDVMITEYSSAGTFCESTLQNDIQDEDIITIEPSASGTRVVPGKNSAFARTALQSELQAMQNCFLFNEDALLYAPTTRDTNNLIFYGLLPEQSLFEVGAHVYPINELKTAQQFSERLATVKIDAESIWTKNGEVYTVQTAQGMKIHIDPNDDPEMLLQNMKTLLENNVITEGYYKTIDYIDLRFGNRVFYREVE